MKYAKDGFYLKPPSLGDIKKIIQNANDFINGRTKQGNVTILEEIGKDDGTSPIKKETNNQK
jgi:hypothetical protein